MGYSFFFDYFIHQADDETVQQLDSNNYNEDELIEIKVPLYLPYYSNLGEYERYDGQIELNGMHYNFVKRKVVNDTLYMLCLPNHVKTELYKAKNEFAAKENGTENAASKKGMESFSKKNNFETEYNQFSFQYNPLYTFLCTWKESVFSSRLNSCFIASPAKPPEIIS